MPKTLKCDIWFLRSAMLLVLSRLGAASWHPRRWRRVAAANRRNQDAAVFAHAAPLPEPEPRLAREVQFHAVAMI